MATALKKHLTPLTKKGSIDKHAGKGSSEETLPSRHALSTLTKGDPGDRTMQNYAKSTPLASPNAPATDIQGLGSGSWGGNGI